MPLILISGYPSSGKTYRSQQLIEDFNSKIASSSQPRISRLSVCHISDQSLGLHREIYREARTEKDARAAEYSAVKRALGMDTIVIADGLNYIKGFRYQLYCEAKSVQTPSCVVRCNLVKTDKMKVRRLTAQEIYIGTPIEKCKEINARLLVDTENDGGYPCDIFDNLIYRYEEPNGMTRWDSPLFTVPYDDEKPPFDDIWEVLVGSEAKAKTVKPNQATVTKAAAEPDYFYEFDKITHEVINEVLSWQKEHPDESGELLVGKIPIGLPPNGVSLPQLHRIRRQFAALNRDHELPKSRIQSSFAEHLDRALK
ncbi:hypothetical protein MMC07_001241 [Pseudocyphellaria aurata]|nr:hypothetical protein [Pseudocyphellaria aurata]